MVKVKSERRSFVGYNLWISVRDQLKEVLRVGVPLAVSWIITKDPTFTALATVGGRFVITAFEYFYKEYS